MRRNHKGGQPARLFGMSSPPSSSRREHYGEHYGRTAKGAAILIALLLSAALCSAQEAWEGNAAVIRRGSFAGPGMLAASNAFPKDSQIEIWNLATGRSVRVTVVQRIQETDDIFLLLSEQAAEQLGLGGSEVIRVRARLYAGAEGPLAGPDGEQAFNPDPDINPAADLKARVPAQEAPAEPRPTADLPAPTPSEPVAPAARPAEAATAEAVSDDQAEPPRDTGPGVVPTTAAGPSAEQKRLTELRDRRPQKQLYQPPRRSERFALPGPEQTPEVAEAVPETEEPAAPILPTEQTPAVAALDREPRLSLLAPREKEESLSVQLPAPRPLDPERPEAEGAPLPPPEEQQLLTLEPASPPVEPPAGEPAAAPAAVAEEETADTAVAALAPTLTAKAYYLQLGAYTSRNLAEKLARDIGTNYEVSIRSVADRNRTVYKVLVGPLNTDESGTLLYLFKARGFKDAFLRYVE